MTLRQALRPRQRRKLQHLARQAQRTRHLRLLPPLLAS